MIRSFPTFIRAAERKGVNRCFPLQPPRLPNLKVAKHRLHLAPLKDLVGIVFVCPPRSITKFLLIRFPDGLTLERCWVSTQAALSNRKAVFCRTVASGIQLVVNTTAAWASYRRLAIFDHHSTDAAAWPNVPRRGAERPSATVLPRRSNTKCPRQPEFRPGVPTLSIRRRRADR